MSSILYTGYHKVFPAKSWKATWKVPATFSMETRFSVLTLISTNPLLLQNGQRNPNHMSVGTLQLSRLLVYSEYKKTRTSLIPDISLEASKKIVPPTDSAPPLSGPSLWGPQWPQTTGREASFVELRGGDDLISILWGYQNWPFQQCIYIYIRIYTSPKIYDDMKVLQVCTFCKWYQPNFLSVANCEVLGQWNV